MIEVNKIFVFLLDTKFDSLFQRRAFIHWYMHDAGYTEDDFIVAREVVAGFRNDYNNVLGSQ